MFKLIKKLIKWSAIAFVGFMAFGFYLVATETPEETAAREQAQIERAAEREAERAAEAAEEAAAQAERERAAAAVEANNRRQGFHCLSAWNGSHRGVVNYLKDRLRDPDSFEHIETRITPVNTAGEHTLIMQYRARNGFGGMNVEYITATVQNDSCRATIVAN